MPPRLADVFGTGMDRQIAGTLGPTLKRVAPRRGDPAPDARALARAADAYDERLSKGQPMPKYKMALDAAPQDGRWLDDPDAVSTVLQFLLSKLSPSDLAELDEHLTKGTAPQAADRRLPDGDLKRDLLKYTPRNRQTMLSALSGARANPSAMDEGQRKSYEEMFPNATRLKRGY